MRDLTVWRAIAVLAPVLRHCPFDRITPQGRGLTGRPGQSAALGMVLRFVALARTWRRPGTYGGRGVALAAIWIGAFGVVFIAGIVVPSYYEYWMEARSALAASNLSYISIALRQYRWTHGAYPPDLLTLVDAGLVTGTFLRNPSVQTSYSVCDYSYVAGLRAGDPDDWILAFYRPPRRGREPGLVLYADGNIRPHGEPRFSEELRRFRLAYEQQRGTPPVVVDPR